MVYVIRNESNKKTFDSYSIENLYMGFGEVRGVRVGYKVSISAEDGAFTSKLFNYILTEDNFLMLDDLWDENSEPFAKPKGFRMEDIATWGGLTTENLPMIEVKRSEKAKSVMKKVDAGDVEKVLLLELIESGRIPNGGTFIAE